MIVFVFFLFYNTPIKHLMKGEIMIPIPVCVQIIVAVAAIVAGKEVLSTKDK